MNQASDKLDRKLRESVLLASRAESDRLMLADAVLAAALDGRRALTASERAALQQSPLTLRRLRQLSIERRVPAAWQGSDGLLRAASGGAQLTGLVTDDGCWTLHLVEQDGRWQVILALAAHAPFAARLLRERPTLRVLDGAGATVLQGQLDADGECESAWPFMNAPGPHFQQHGAGFRVEPVAR
ncbi:MAG: hypothetical protein V4508_19690 [Pseudomonadota bacterium]